MTIRTKTPEFLIKRDKKTHKTKQEAILLVRFSKYCFSDILSQKWMHIDKSRLRLILFATLKDDSKIQKRNFNVRTMSSYPRLTALFWTEFSEWKKENPELYVLDSYDN